MEIAVRSMDSNGWKMTEMPSMPRCLFVLVTTLALVSQAIAQDRTFGGYDCTDNCEGHSAGYKWAEEHDIDDPADCPYGHSQSFHEGCLAYTEDSTRDPDQDDDGNAVGEPVVPPEER
jgi:hypothetical protein